MSLLRRFGRASFRGRGVKAGGKDSKLNTANAPLLSVSSLFFPISLYGDGAILKNAQRYKNKARIAYLGFRRARGRKCGRRKLFIQ